MLYVNPLESQHAARIGAVADPKAKEKVALREFEHLFLFTLLQEMRKTISIGGDTEKGAEKDLYAEMLDDALSGQMAASGQLGVAKQMEQQLRIAEMQPLLRNHPGHPAADAAVKAPGPTADK